MKGFLFLFTFYFQIAFSQGVDNIWLMGYDCCSQYFNPMNINFSSGNLVIDTVTRNMNINCTNAEISDANGNLLFYTNGIYVTNSLNLPMLNGQGLSPCNFTTSRTQYGLSIPQAAMIIPFPND